MASELQTSTRGNQARRQTQAKNADGNAIRVRIRVRPLGEGRGKLCSKLTVDTQRGLITVANSSADSQQHSFAYDTVYESQDNAAIYSHLGQPLVESVLA